MERNYQAVCWRQERNSSAQWLTNPGSISSWVLKAYIGLKEVQMSSCKRNPPSTIMGQLYWRSFCWKTPPQLCFPLGAHQCFGQRTAAATPPLIAGCDSHQQSSPAGKSRSEGKGSKVLLEGRCYLKGSNEHCQHKTPQHQWKQNKRQNIHTANLYNMIITQVIASHPTSYSISL